MTIRVQTRDNEPVEKALRRLRKLCNNEGITRTSKAKAYFEKPSERRRRESRERQKAIRLSLRAQRQDVAKLLARRKKARKAARANARDEDIGEEFERRDWGEGGERGDRGERRFDAPRSFDRPAAGGGGFDRPADRPPGAGERTGDRGGERRPFRPGGPPRGTGGPPRDDRRPAGGPPPRRDDLRRVPAPTRGEGEPSNNG